MVLDLDDPDGKANIMHQDKIPEANVPADTLGPLVNSINTSTSAESPLLPPNRALTHNDIEQSTAFSIGTTANKVCDSRQPFIPMQSIVM